MDKTSDPSYEAVNSPPHYNAGDIEHIEYAEDNGWAQGYCLGSTTKYIQRAGKKPGADALEDLKKAWWYLDRYISWLERGKGIWKISRCEEKTAGHDAGLASSYLTIDPAPAPPSIDPALLEG